MHGIAAHGRAAAARLDDLVGGPARRHVIVVLALVLALDSADKATIGTSATQLKAGLGIGDAQIGLLLTISSFVGAVASLPFGALVDRLDRTRLLTGSILCWALATALSGIATSFVFLLLVRVGLGLVTAVAGPAVASLTGDYFPQSERARIYGFVLSGELIGAGFGFVVAGQFALVSWRAPFLTLVLPSLLVGWLVHRLPEPARSGASRIPQGTEEIRRDQNAHEDPQHHEETEKDTAGPARVIGRSRATPRRAAVLDVDPRKMTLWQTVRYVLRVRTNVVLIVASALGYFFFSGVRGFGIEFSKKHYAVSHSVATTLTLALGIGALAGVLLGGRVADRLLRRGRVAARPEVAGVAVLLATCLFLPALIVPSVAIGVPLLVLAAMCLGAANPPLDAARLDIVVAPAWGRAEAIRSFLRSCGDAAAPLLFGVLAQSVFGGPSGLEYTFLLMLVSLLGAALIMLFVGRRTYPSDVAAASESEDRWGGGRVSL